MIVQGNKDIFSDINYNLKWAENDSISALLYNHYRFFTPVYCDNATMNNRVQEIATLNADYFNQLYDTTQYEYNPIWNVEGSEEYTDIDTYDLVHDNTSAQYPENQSSKRPVANDNNTQKGTITRTHKATRGGNIGVTMTQQLIEAERRIIIKLQIEYIKIFNDLFMLSL